MNTSLKKFAGPCRVVVDRITPSVDGGKMAVKRVIGDTFTVEGHVFADGHDIVRAFLRYRRVGEKRWHSVAMRDVGNDVFFGEFTPDVIGLYEYTIAGVIDHFTTWHLGFAKKADADGPLDVELQIGAGLLCRIAKQVKGEDRKVLDDWARFIEDPKRDLNQRVSLVRSHEFYHRIAGITDFSNETEGEVCLLSVERERAAFSTWYEYFPRSCADDVKRHGTFRDAATRLPEVARMGFNIIYFPPIHPIGRSFRKGKNNSLTPSPEDVGSPWAVGAEEGGHKAILPALGTLADFQWFLGEANTHGLEVALDIAFQCAPDHPYVKAHPEWFVWRPDGTVQYAENPPKKYQDILPINFESTDWENLWKELKTVFEYWIDVGVKIFRVDNPHTKSFEFWHWCIREIKEAHPDVIFLAEAFTRPKRMYWLAKAGFTHGYSYFTWRNNARDLRAYVEELTQTEVKEYFYPNFWPNTPDILHEDLQKGNRATYLGRYILAATLSSNMGVYGPAYELMDNEPFPGKEENNNNEKYELKHWDWDALGNLKEDIARVNRARNENSALQRTQNIVFAEVDNPHLIAYVKQSFDRENQILVVVNMDWYATQSGVVHVPMDALGFGSDAAYRVRDLNDPQGQVYTWHGSKNFVKLDPRKSPAHIFRIER